MNKFSIAKVEATVRCALFISRKKYQISGLEFIRRGFYSKFVLFISGAGQADPVLGKNILQIARAIKGFGGSTAKLIGSADVFFGRGNNPVDLTTGNKWRIVGTKAFAGRESKRRSSWR